MAMLRIKELPREVRDRIELREQMDQTFWRFTSEDYSDEFWNVVVERSNPGVQHSLILSLNGAQGCWAEGTLISTEGGLKRIEDVLNGEKVWTRQGLRRCELISKGKQDVVGVELRNGQVLRMTRDHVVWSKRGWIEARELVVGDVLSIGDVPWSGEWNDESEKACVVAMLLADGHIDFRTTKEKYSYKRVSNREMKRKPKEYHEWVVKRARFYKSDEVLRDLFRLYCAKHFGSRSDAAEYADINTEATKVVCICNSDVIDKLISHGVPVGKKSSTLRIPDWVLRSDAAMNGFLAGYFACDGSFYQGGIEISSCSNELVSQMTAWLQTRGCVVKVKAVRRHGNHSDIYRLFVRHADSLKLWLSKVPNLSPRKVVVEKDVSKDEVAVLKYSNEVVGRWVEMSDAGLNITQISSKVSEEFGRKIEPSVVWKAMKVFRRGNRGKKRSKCVSVDDMMTVVNVRDCGEENVYDLSVCGVHEYYADGVLSHNSGKSWSAISICNMLDPNFSVDKIFFSYNDLVHNRAKLKENSAVLLDEQTQSYGMDSHRVMMIMNSLKEQLRKKSIHLIFCSPVLHEESKTSMYLMEIMFVDKETEEAVAALYTREGHTLGHVRIPSPLKVLSDGTSLATKEMMDAYERKKDEHLERILGQKSVDIFEDRANAVMATDVFKKAELIYVKKLGYIPRDRVVQVVNIVFPEYNAGVVPQEIADRIRMKKEIEGKWFIPGSRKPGIK